MADEHQKINDAGDEVKDRGLFDFIHKKEEEKPQEEVIASELEKVHVSEPEHKEEEKLHRSNSSSSSSVSSPKLIDHQN